MARVSAAARRAVVLVAAMIVLCGGGAAAAPSGAARSFQAKVIHVADGDTVTVLVANRPVKIRVEGIDCPEMRQAFGRVARTFTWKCVYGKSVEIQPWDTDRYGRTVARIKADGEDLGFQLLSAGLAWHYTRYSNDPAYAHAEQEARAKHVGLWSDRAPVPPWVERRSPARPAAPRVTAATPQKSGPYHGNVRSMVFHAPGCPHYNCRQCTAVFATREEALAHGFRPAGDCIRQP